ncbi:MAG: fluoride efflux transporter CrcB [Myxococcales bacterium]|nr:fluoride efflux transporter CrcB [Myxococcales bacterium]
MHLLLVCIGGAMGSGFRHLISLWATRTFGGSTPWGTLLVNIVGSMLLGMLMKATESTELRSLRLLLGTGLMGGFTTYSTFNLETLQMLERGSWPQAFTYFVSTGLLCLAAGGLGWAYLGRWLQP